MTQLTSALSIAGRITGVVWSFGMLILVWWLVATAAGPGAYGAMTWFLTSWLGVLGMVGLTAAAWYHTLNGIRHPGLGRRLWLRPADHLQVGPAPC